MNGYKRRSDAEDKERARRGRGRASAPGSNFYANAKGTVGDGRMPAGSKDLAPNPRPQQPPVADYYTNSEGQTGARARPSSSRAVATTTPQKGGLPANPKPAALPPPEPRGPTDFYTNKEGQTTRGFGTSSSRAVAPTAGQKGGLPATVEHPGAGTAKTASGFGEPNYRDIAERKTARARQSNRIKADTSAYEAQRAKQDSSFSNASAEERSRIEREKQQREARRARNQQKKADKRAARTTRRSATTTPDKPQTRTQKLKSGVGRFGKAAGVVGGALSLQDMAENGIDAENAGGLALSALGSEAVREGGKRLAQGGGRLAASAAPAALVGASGYGGYKYGENLHGRMDEGQELNPVEAGIGFLGTRLGESYARYAPEFMGGMSSETAENAPDFTTYDEIRNGDPSRQQVEPSTPEVNQQQVAQTQTQPQSQPRPVDEGSVGTLEPMPQQQAAPASAPQPQTDNNVTFDPETNSFSGGVVGQGYTVNGQAQGGPNIADPQSGQNREAINRLMAGTPEFGAGAGFQRSDNRPNYYIGRDSSIEDRADRQALKAASTPYAGAQNGQLTANQINAMRGIARDRRSDATSRENNQATNQAQLERAQHAQSGQNQRAGARLALDQSRIEGEQQERGFRVRQSQRLEDLREQYASSQNPEERSAIAEQLKILSGDSGGSNGEYKTVLLERPVDPSRPEAGSMKVPYTFSTRTGQPVPTGQSPAATTGRQPSKDNIRALRLGRDNPELVAQFEQEFDLEPGGAQRYLGDN